MSATWTYAATGRARRSVVGKRILDLSLAVLAGVLLAPVLAVVAVLVRLSLGSPVLFRQARLGRHGQTFVLIKFRTMRDAVDRNGNPLPDQDRLTWLGRVLRASSLDELPELWNVLVGEMSLVGPRPLLARYRDRYTPREWHRHDVLPGITGWAQVHGRNAQTWSERFALDLWYVRHGSIIVDLGILWATVRVVLGHAGVSAPGHATMPELRPGMTVGPGQAYANLTVS